MKTLIFKLIVCYKFFILMTHLIIIILFIEFILLLELSNSFNPLLLLNNFFKLNMSQLIINLDGLSSRLNN